MFFLTLALALATRKDHVTSVAPSPAAGSYCSQDSHSKMLGHAEVPILLQRKHVVRGYRPMNQPRYYYYKSAFTHHNEMMNVWTHLIPAFLLVIVYIIPELFDENRYPLLVLYFSIFCLLIGSSFAHLLHSRSHLDHVFWYLIDFSGIAMFGLGIGLQRYACNQDMSTFTRFAYLPMLMAIVLGMQFLSSCYLFVCQPHWPYRLYLRMFTCFLLALWLYIPLWYRYTNTDPNDDSLTQHSRAFYWLLLSGIFMGAQVPERFAPGLFDIYGYGHQLFHICIDMVAWNLCHGAHHDCTPVTSSWMSGTNLAVSFSLGISIIFIICTICFLMGKAKHVKYD